MITRPGTGRGARPGGSNESDSAPTVRQLQPVPEEIRALSPLTEPGYVDAFSMTGGIPGRSAERWARAMFEDVAGINALWRVLLGLHLRATPDRVSGWDIAERGEDWIRLEVESWLWTNHIVVQADDEHVSLATFIRYDRPLASRVWLPMSRKHRREAPRLLRGACGVLQPRTR
jgi:hypothetical protein